MLPEPAAAPMLLNFRRGEAGTLQVLAKKGESCRERWGEIRGKSWGNHGKNIGKSWEKYRKIMEKSWKLIGNPKGNPIEKVGNLAVGCGKQMGKFGRHGTLYLGKSSNLKGNFPAMLYCRRACKPFLVGVFCHWFCPTAIHVDSLYSYMTGLLYGVSVFFFSLSTPP